MISGVGGVSSTSAEQAEAQAEEQAASSGANKGSPRQEGDLRRWTSIRGKHGVNWPDWQQQQAKPKPQEPTQPPPATCKPKTKTPSDESSGGDESGLVGAARALSLQPSSSTPQPASSAPRPSSSPSTSTTASGGIQAPPDTVKLTELLQRWGKDGSGLEKHVLRVEGSLGELQQLLDIVKTTTSDPAAPTTQSASKVYSAISDLLRKDHLTTLASSADRLYSKSKKHCCSEAKVEYKQCLFNLFACKFGQMNLGGGVIGGSGHFFSSMFTGHCSKYPVDKDGGAALQALLEVYVGQLEDVHRCGSDFMLSADKVIRARHSQQRS